MMSNHVYGWKQVRIVRTMSVFDQGNLVVQGKSMAARGIDAVLRLHPHQVTRLMPRRANSSCSRVR